MEVKMRTTEPSPSDRERDREPQKSQGRRPGVEFQLRDLGQLALRLCVPILSSLIWDGP